ncbi:MAG: cob(I)yrinic acid a,c-diamide adenosyltransferase [Bacteroidales bacterium]|nr:cob(I)yrinic acid a,c-diamide adenosyltransferase [Bacteroidales bacterium]
MKNQGLVHIYTGDGKGKTTSAVGLGVRALGHNLKVCYAYFHKNPEKYGYTEINQLEKLGGKIFGFAKSHPFCDKEITEEDLKQQCADGINFLKKEVLNGGYNLLIIDEILISVRDGYLSEETLVDFIKNKPTNLELVMTGRGATEKLMQLADYVSNITKVKHPYDNKILSRKGIEF